MMTSQAAVAGKHFSMKLSQSKAWADQPFICLLPVVKTVFEGTQMFDTIVLPVIPVMSQTVARWPLQTV